MNARDTLQPKTTEFPGTQMQAVWIERFGGDDVLTAGICPIPPYGPHDVLVAIESAGVGLWDVLIREGKLPATSPFPLTLGLEGAGVVAAIGSEVTGFSIGDAVFGMVRSGHDTGTYAGYARFDATTLAHRPPQLDARTAGGVPVAALTAHQALFADLTIVAGETLLVTGAAGAVGSMAVQIARAAGIRVVALVRPDHVRQVRALGAQIIVPLTSEDSVAELLRAVPGGVDAALDTTVALFDAALRALRPGGRIGDLTPQVPKPARTGVTVHAIAGRPDGSRLNGIAQLFARGALRFAIAAALPLGAAVEAHRALARGGAAGKTVLLP